LSNSVLIMGKSGDGKTSAIRTLDPKTTFIINSLGKDLPWKGSAKQYPIQEMRAGGAKGNMIITTHTREVMVALEYVNNARPEIKEIVIDDNTFFTSLELLRRTKETSWDKFSDIANNFIDLTAKSRSLRKDLIVYILHHTTTEGDGVLEDFKVRAQSYGKLIDEKLGSIEAQFSIVLRASKNKTDDGIEYVFYTKDASSTCKSPVGMFEEDTIPNDLAYVSSKIREYYN